MSFLESKAFRLVWVILLAVSAFVLGYTINPRTGRSPGLQSAPAFGGMGGQYPSSGRFVMPPRR